MPSPSDIPADTRSRLLEAAGEIFAEQGFRQATVRDIIVRAGVNLAAVNYHFGDKLGLYQATMGHWMGVALERHPPDGGLTAGAPGAQRLHAFVRSFLFRLLGEGVPAWHGRLMAREMADPTLGVIEALVDTHIRGHAQMLFAIVHELLGPAGGDAERVRQCGFSVVGQCLFYRQCQPSIRLIAPAQKFDGEQIERIAEHVTRVALAGIESYRLDVEAMGTPQKSRRAAAAARTGAKNKERS